MQNLPKQTIKSNKSPLSKHQYQNQQLVVVQLSNSTKKIAKIIRTNLYKDQNNKSKNTNKEVQYLDDNKIEILEQFNIMPCTQSQLPLKKIKVLIKKCKQDNKQINQEKQLVDKKNLKNNEIEEQIIVISDDSDNKFKHKIIQKGHKNKKQHKNKQKFKHNIIDKNSNSVLPQEQNKVSHMQFKPIQQNKQKQKLQDQVIQIKQNLNKQENLQIQQKVEIQQKISKSQKINPNNSAPSSILFPYNYQNDPTFKLSFCQNFLPYFLQTNYSPYSLFTYTNQFIPNFNPYYLTFHQNSNSTSTMFPTHQLQHFQNSQLVFKLKEILHYKNLEEKQIDIILNKIIQSFNGNPSDLTQILKVFQMLSKDEIVKKYSS